MIDIGRMRMIYGKLSKMRNMIKPDIFHGIECSEISCSNTPSGSSP
jgi:hypothetical protein